jgi:hypothetical protein
MAGHGAAGKVRQGEARLGEAWHGLPRLGKAGEACFCKAWRGMAFYGDANKFLKKQGGKHD